MTDLVFLLLIFFIILSTQVNPPNIPLNLPSSKPPEMNPPAIGIIKISVNADNQYFFGLHGDLVDSEDLEKLILNQVLMTGDSVVELSGDKTSSWQSNVNVIDIAKKNGLKLVIKTKF